MPTQPPPELLTLLSNLTVGTNLPTVWVDDTWRPTNLSGQMEWLHAHGFKVMWYCPMQSAPHHYAPWLILGLIFASTIAAILALRWLVRWADGAGVKHRAGQDGYQEDQ